MTDAASVLRANGIVADPALVIRAAAEAGLPLAAMCAKLVRESYGGRNTVGNDRVDDGGQYTKGGNAGDRAMTDRYLRWRGPAGAHRGRQQGWGPSQLTWAELQDAAEAEGGLNDPLANMRVGARELARCLKAAGGSWRDAGARYNGGRAYNDPKTIEPAREYGRWLEGAVAEWERKLTGATAPPASSSSSSSRPVLRRGSTGPTVKDLQRVLAAWYPDLHLAADGDYGPATEAAVRRLQTNARITVDGIAGGDTYRALGM